MLLKQPDIIRKRKAENSKSGKTNGNEERAFPSCKEKMQMKQECDEKLCSYVLFHTSVVPFFQDKAISQVMGKRNLVHQILTNLKNRIVGIHSWCKRKPQQESRDYTVSVFCQKKDIFSSVSAAGMSLMMCACHDGTGRMGLWLRIWCGRSRVEFPALPVWPWVSHLTASLLIYTTILNSDPFVCLDCTAFACLWLCVVQCLTL